MLPLSIRKFLRYESPVETLTSCMLSLSVGVYQSKLGGLAELAADIKVEVETEEPAKTFELLLVSVKLVNGKWSLPLGQPLSQYTCHVRPARDIRSVTRLAADMVGQREIIPEPKTESYAVFSIAIMTI